MVKVTSLLSKAGSALGSSFGVRAQTEKKILCVKGMYMLKVVASEKLNESHDIYNVNFLCLCVTYST